jgi:hypothetical protein
MDLNRTNAGERLPRSIETRHEECCEGSGVIWKRCASSPDYLRSLAPPQCGMAEPHILTALAILTALRAKKMEFVDVLVSSVAMAPKGRCFTKGSPKGFGRAVALVVDDYTFCHI